MSSRSGDLLDVGVWVALSEPKHADHQRATKYWQESAKPPLAFCRVTALGLVRLLCQKTGEAVVPWNLVDAWNAYGRWREDSEILFVEEPRSIEAQLDHILSSTPLPLCLWTDAYLAAFAISAGLRLVTFDSDFERFPGLDLLRL